MSGILEAIERRAQARGYEVIRIRRCADEGPGVLVHDGLESVVWRVKDANTLSRVVLRGHMAKATMAHLQGSIAGEGAARVLSVVSQVAALLQGQRLAWVAGVGERVKAAVDAVPVHDHSRVRMQACASCGSVEWREGFAHEMADYYCRGCGRSGEVQGE